MLFIAPQFQQLFAYKQFNRFQSQCFDHVSDKISVAIKRIDGNYADISMKVYHSDENLAVSGKLLLYYKMNRAYAFAFKPYESA